MRRRRWDVTARPGNLRLARLGHMVEVFQTRDELDNPGVWGWTCDPCAQGGGFEGEGARAAATEGALQHVGLSVRLSPPRKRAQNDGRAHG